jgi:impB/mucB/samB family
MMPEERAGESSAEAGRPRKIIHVDMDAFYASVEQRDNPELRGKPVAVGGSRERGVVAAASYEARKFGVHSAMPSITAKRKCPDLIFVKPRFDAYKAISLQIREIFAAYTPIIEPLSLDEAYLDVTENLKGIISATQIAEEIRARIRAETELTASAGVSYNKFLAKLASDHRKPDGLFVITPKMGQAFVETLPVRKFHGVGPATAKKRSASGSRPGSTSAGRPSSFCSNISGKRAPIITGLRAASTSGQCVLIGCENPSAPRTRFQQISSPTKLLVMRFERSLIRCGNTARGPVSAAGQSRSRSSSLTSSRSREAAPVRCRSGHAANSNNSVMHCSNLSFLS